MQAPSERPENLLPELSPRSQAPLELVCDEFARNLLVHRGLILEMTRAIEADFSFGALERVASQLQAPVEVVVRAIAQEQALLSPNRAMLVLEELPNLYTGSDYKLRVAVSGRSSGSNYYVPVNQSAASLGLSSAVNLLQAEPLKGATEHNALDVRHREVGARYRRVSERALVRVKMYQQLDHSPVVALIEFLHG